MVMLYQLPSNELFTLSEMHVLFEYTKIIYGLLLEALYRIVPLQKFLKMINLKSNTNTTIIAF